MPHGRRRPCLWRLSHTGHRYTGTLLCLKKPTSHPAVRHGGNILTYVRDGRNKAAPIPNSLPETTSSQSPRPSPVSAHRAWQGYAPWIQWRLAAVVRTEVHHLRRRTPAGQRQSGSVSFRLKAWRCQTQGGKDMRLGFSGAWPRLCGQRRIISIEAPPWGVVF
jgi:hypothetical protein